MTTDLFRGIGHKVDFRPDCRKEYESRVASKGRILDVGGRNAFSESRKKVDSLSRNPNKTVISSDILFHHKPDLVDDICCSSIKANSFDGVFCQAVLEHVQEYWKAIEHIRRVLRKGGEAFFYVPFMFHFHDEMDHHRFTFTELERMLRGFEEVRIFAPGETDGFGWVWWYILTFTGIGRFKRLHRSLSKLTDAALGLVLAIVYRIRKAQIEDRYGSVSFREFRFYYTYLFMNHGFCAWAKK